MSNKNQKKEIPTKNYFVLGIIILITVLFFVYFFSWLHQYNDSKINTPIITSTLREVEYNNLNTVLTERDMLIMYMCTTDESICRNFEKKFVNYIKEKNLSEDIMYLNLGYDSDENNLLSKVYNKYKSPDLVKKIYEYPTLLIFKDSKIIDVLSSNGKTKLTIEDVNSFLESYEL